MTERPLLVVDGDSFAHRAYHALPRSIRRGNGRPGNLLVGLANMLAGLWQAEEPRAVLVGWDSLAHPTYRHEAFAGYQAGREFEDALLEQLDMAPELAASFGFACAKAPGYEADDFLAAAVASTDGPVLVATSDRDAFQLASERVTILKPRRGISEIDRVGPPEVRATYGVEPEQVPDFIALRGDPSDRIPGARGVGTKRAAELLRQYGSLEAMLEAGRFVAEAEALRLYRHVATLDAAAPLPQIADGEADWARAAKLAGEWGLDRLSERLEALSSA